MEDVLNISTGSRYVVMLRGLPCSGKTTKAKEYVGSGYKRICRDEIRSMLEGGKYSPITEKGVVSVRDAMLLSLMRQRENIVIDDTHLDPRWETHYRELVEEFNSELPKTEDNPYTGQYKLSIVFCEVELDIAIKRDLARANSIGPDVIRRMYYEFLHPAKAASYQTTPIMPVAAMVDLDNTLNIIGSRDYYDIYKAIADEPNLPVIKTVKSLSNSGYCILIVTGRDEKYRQETIEWLNKHSIPYTGLYMRGYDDPSSEVKVKRDLFQQNIKNTYAVELVIDDQNSCVDMWRSIGIPTFQVAPGFNQ